MSYYEKRYSPPLNTELISTLTEFWHNIYGTDESWLIPILEGKEISHNSDAVYTIWQNEQIVSTVHLTVSRNNPWLGGLGEVATIQPHRRKGLALSLCTRAVEDFESLGGRALFLGTNNPHAAKLYRSLGWRYIAGTKVMVRIRECDLPEEFLFNMYRELPESQLYFEEMTATHRITMIPLMVTPHPWMVLDMNVHMFSTRFAVQGSCMGLYPQYQEFWRRKGGKSWCLRTENNMPIGIASTYCVSETDALSYVYIDGFVDPIHLNRFDDLLGHVLRTPQFAHPQRVQTQVLHHDFEKKNAYQNAGFNRQMPSGDVEVSGDIYQSSLLTNS